jgi:CRP/FNR family transcriptional regulator, anaerobic regulatory protein
VARFDKLIIHRRPIKEGAYLYSAGAPLESLHVIHSGFLKTTVGNETGLEQVTAFLMPGDPAGMDGIASGKHQSNTVAIEDSSACGISYVQLEKLCRELPILERHFEGLLSNEINLDYALMMSLGVMHAEERFASFLLSLSARFAARGDSAIQFRLPMKHHEIGSYLGLSLETISRLITKFSKEELIALNHKYIQIKTIEGLNQRIEDYKKRWPPFRTRGV